MKKTKAESRILIAMSGGMDSAVAAALLKSEGHALTALHLQIRPLAGAQEFESRCMKRSDSDGVQAICAKLDIPLKVLDASEAFDSEVIDYAVHEYLQVRKPDPCVRCNQRIKLAVLDNYAVKHGFSLIATGHFAQLSREPQTGSARLQKASEAAQDQSYYLYGVPAETLSRAVMPLGGISRAMVRKLARQFGLPERQSQDGIYHECFAGGPALHALIEKRSDSSVRSRGIIRTLDGKVLGEHHGLYRHSIGERRSTNETGNQQGKEEFIIAFDHNPVSMIVGPERLLFRQDIYASDARWIHPPSTMKGLRCKARMYRQMEEVPVQVTLFENQVLHVLFDQPIKTVVPGQTIVFYDGDEVLGGATVDRFGTPPKL